MQPFGRLSYSLIDIAAIMEQHYFIYFFLFQKYFLKFDQFNFICEPHTKHLFFQIWPTKLY